MKHDDPNQIANDLVEKHGLDDAIKVALENAAAAGDNYALSVWREVKEILRKKKAVQN